MKETPELPDNNKEGQVYFNWRDTKGWQECLFGRSLGEAGHASTTTTSVIYSHSIRSADELASEVLDDLLKPQVGGRRQVV